MGCWYAYPNIPNATSVGGGSPLFFCDTRTPPVQLELRVKSVVSGQDTFMIFRAVLVPVRGELLNSHVCRAFRDWDRQPLLSTRVPNAAE